MRNPLITLQYLKLNQEPRQLGETCGGNFGECADGLVCSIKRRIIKTEYKNSTSGRLVSIVNDDVGVVQPTCVKKEDIQGI